MRVFFRGDFPGEDEDSSWVFGSGGGNVGAEDE